MRLNRRSRREIKHLAPMQSNTSQVPVVALVGGTDCSGGAGLSADIAVARHFGAFPMPVVSCVTSQGPDGLRMMTPIEESLFADQLSAVLDNVRPSALKIGMLPSARHMAILREMLEDHKVSNVVFDPVMAPTAGAANFKADWWEEEQELRAFMQCVDMATPNLVELARLTAPLLSPCEEYPGSSRGASGRLTDADALQSGRIFLKHYHCRHLLLTGGHNVDHPYCDILFTADPSGDAPLIARFTGSEVPTPNTHGTGCVYSSAIATLLAFGHPARQAVQMARLLMHNLLVEGARFRLYPDRPESHGPTFVTPPASHQ